MKFYFENDLNLEELKREAFRDLYIKKIKEINKLKKQVKKHSEAQGQALETFEGTKSNTNHKNDMAIMQKNNQIIIIKKEIEAIDEEFDFNLFNDNNLLFEKYKKTILEYKENYENNL